ncbi:MAG: hypothetical protein IT168_20415 [Bryobacterales bacterium]|nr:hypothetical protein [Bryobacterales bacterium]
MPSFIPKQPKKEREQITIKLDRDVLRSLELYCRYLDSSRDYVIGAALEFIFRKDKQFAEWAEQHGDTRTPVAPVQASFDPQFSAERRTRKVAPRAVPPPETAA